MIPETETENSLDLAEVLKSGLVFCASKGHGKTNGLKIMIQRFKKEMPSASIKVIDYSLNFAFNSDMPYFQVVEANKPVIMKPNIIYDLCLLPYGLTTDFLRSLIEHDMKKQIMIKLNQKGYINNPILYALDDSYELLGRYSLTKDINKSLLKFVSTGRNFGEMSYILCTQRLQSISTEALERINSYLFGRIIGDTNLRKIRSTLGDKDVVNRIKTLKIGEFVYYNGQKTQVITFPLFKTNNKPLRI